MNASWKLMNSDLEPEVRNEAVKEIRQQYLSAEKARRVLVGARFSRWTKAWTDDRVVSRFFGAGK